MRYSEMINEEAQRKRALALRKLMSGSQRTSALDTEGCVVDESIDHNFPLRNMAWWDFKVRWWQ